MAQPIAHGSTTKKKSHKPLARVDLNQKHFDGNEGPRRQDVDRARSPCGTTLIDSFRKPPAD
jgi:hypothetical protein